jgi:uncharacterized protein (TIGR03437 family)
MGRTFLAGSTLILFLLTLSALSAFGAQIAGTPVKIAGWDICDPGHQADGLPATLTCLPDLAGVWAEPDGSILVAVDGLVRQIGTDGRVRTLIQDNSLSVVYPSMLAMNSQGDIYYGNATFINKVAAASYAAGPATVYQHIAGGGNAASQEGAPASNAFIDMQGITLDPAGNVLFSDLDTRSVWRIDSAGLLHRVAGTGNFGSGTSGPAVAADLQAPEDLAYDGAGNLYIVDYRRVVKVKPDGTLSVVPVGVSADAGLLTIAVDAAGNLYYGSFDGGFEIFRLDPAGGNTFIAGTQDATLSNGCGSGSQPGVGDAKTASLGDSDIRLALDAAGNLLVADAWNIRQITPSGQIRTIAGGLPSFSGDGGPALAATLATPRGLAYDGSGNLYIADTGNNRIRKITTDGIIDTVVGQGGPTADMIYSCSGSSDSYLNSPWAVAVDSAGNLYVADTGKHRVMKQAPDGTLTRFAGTGTAGYQVSPIGTAAVSIPLNEPRAVGVDHNGNVYVGDDAMRTLKISPAGAIVDVFPRVRARSFSTDRDGNLYLTAAFIAYQVNDDDTLLPLAGLGQSLIDYDSPPPVEEPSANDLGTGSGLTRDAQGTLYNIGTEPNGIDLISTACHRITLPLASGFDAYYAAHVAESPQGDVYMADFASNVVWRLPHLIPEAGDAPTPALAEGAPVRNAGSQLVATKDVITVVNYYSPPIYSRFLVSDPIAPGEIVRITGQCLGPYQTAVAAFDSSGTLPFTLGGAQVNIGGLPAPLIAAQQGGITAIVPLGVAVGSAPTLTVTYGGASAQETEQVAAFQPGLFRFLELDGSATAAAINQDGTINSQTHPAPAGWVVALYATGLGATNPPGTDGRPINNLNAKYGANVQVTVNGLPAAVQYAGPAPGFAGLSQINVTIPQTSTGPVRVLIGTAPFNQPVQVWVK